MDGEVPQRKAPQVSNKEQTPSISEIPQRESLDEKSPLQTIDFGDLGKVAFRDMEPETPRPGGEVPMVMMTGWAMNQDVIANTTDALVRNGQRVIPFDIVGGRKGLVNKISGLSANEIVREGELLKKWIEEQGEEKYHLAGQSMSALTILSMIENNPQMADKIASVILISPMGLAGDPAEHTAPETAQKGLGGRVIDAAKRKILGRGLDNLMQRKAVEDTRNSQREKTDEDHQIEPKVDAAWKSFIKSSPARAIKEVLAMGKADEYDILNLLKARGIKVGIIQGIDDKLNSSQGVVDNIARHAVSEGNVDPQFVGANGMEKIPDELQIKDTDTPDEVKRKQAEILKIKMILSQTEARPPIDSLRWEKGGHEILGPAGFAKKLINEADYLMQNDEEKQAKIEETQGLERVRQQLAESIDTTQQTPPSAESPQI